jgi:hypothetical protein
MGFGEWKDSARLVRSFTARWLSNFLTNYKDGLPMVRQLKLPQLSAEMDPPNKSVSPDQLQTQKRRPSR